MSLLDSILEKLRRHPKRIVFPDGEDQRVVRAAQLFYESGAGIPVLLGNREKIHAIAEANGVSLKRVLLVDPATASDFPHLCAKLERLARFLKMDVPDPAELLRKPNYYATMMLQYAQADGLVGATLGYAGALLRPLMHLVKPLPEPSILSSCVVAEFPRKDIGDEGVLLFADCGVLVEPDTEQLATIAVQTGAAARHIFGHRPRVALLSFSTKGSTRTPLSQKVADATVIAREFATKLGVEMVVDGEMQADAAIVPAIAERKMKSSIVGGKANVLIFPDLNSGNIAIKLLHHLTDARFYGYLILGLTRPAAYIPRGATTEEIFGMAAIVALQAIKYRDLYPRTDEDFV